MNGPTGGASYLSVATFPYQLSIVLARPATFVVMQVSRANTSSGTVTLAVTALRNGNPVSSGSLTLSTVNEWTQVSLSNAGGFDALLIDPDGGANQTFGVDGVQFSSNCYGFADVQPADSFCNAAEWLANRGVTLGCGAGQYCPGQNVTRAQMALFMQRLGNALTPTIVVGTGSSLGGTFSTPSYLCHMVHTVGASPQVASLQASVWSWNASALKQLDVWFHVSTNQGATWTNAGDFYTPLAAVPGQVVGVVERARVALQPGRTYRFAVRVLNGAGYMPGSSAAVAVTDCEARALIFNRTTDEAPFDALATPPSQGNHGL